MKSLTSITAAALAGLAMTACAANPPPPPGSGGPGYYGNAPYDDGYGAPVGADRPYVDPRYDDRYGNDRYDRYDARYHGERARRYYYIDTRTGATVWVNGQLRTR